MSFNILPQNAAQNNHGSPLEDKIQASIQQCGRWKAFSVSLQTDCIVLGCEDGIIRVYDFPQSRALNQGMDEPDPRLCLETKGGPVQSLVLADITRFSTADLIVGDSRGTMTIFCNGQILSRQSLSEHSISSLQVDTDATGNVSVIAGDSGGLVHALRPYSNLWKLRLDSTLQQAESPPSRVRCLLAAVLVTSSGQTSNYILASDDSCKLHFIQQGSIVLTLQTHTVVTAMCCGNFLPQEELSTSEMASQAPASQVALGGKDGSILIMSDFQIHISEYANIQLPIMHLAAIATGHPDELDSLLCAGLGNNVMLYHNRTLLNEYEASAWINSVAVTNMDKSDETGLLIGCMDGSLHSLKIS